MCKNRLIILALIISFRGCWLYGQHAELKPAVNYGGKSQWNALLNMAMQYPESARLAKAEGKVVVRAVISSTAEVYQPKIEKPVHPDLDREALWLFRHLLWEPASFRGTPTDSQVTMEVEFNLKKYQKLVRKRGYDQLNFPHQPVDTTLRIYKISQLTEAPVPLYPGNARNFPEFIINHLVYPSAAIKQNISGTVELFFIIEPFGKASNIKVLKSVPGGCTEEAIRLLKMISWKPGIKGGYAVRTETTMSVTFNLADYEKLRYIPAGNPNQF